MSNNRRKSKSERELCADVMNQFEKFCNTQQCSTCELHQNELWELSEEHNLNLKCETIYLTQVMENRLKNRPQIEDNKIYKHIMFATDMFGTDITPDYKGQLFVGFRITKSKKVSKYPEDYIWCKIITENEIDE